MMRKLIFSLALLLSFGASAQQFGGFPPSTRWKQIHTDTARVIFDAASGAAGRRVSTLIHRMAADTSNHLGAALRKVPVVLHSRTTLANGYVALAPFRSEFYLIPGSNIFEFGALPWSEQLAIHEYRHVHQYNQFRVGLSRVAYYLLGQEGQAVANGAAVPAWFFEGDAVHAETVLTPQGRGRMPLFLNGYNSLWQAGRHYRVMKLLNGSYKDYVPNHYQFGYFMVNYGNLRYGNTFWPKVTRDAAAFRGLIFPFSQAVRRYSGQRIRPFYREALRYYEGQRREKDTLRAEGKTVVDYFFPRPLGSDSLVYLKSGYRNVPTFYLKDRRGEHRIRQRSISTEEWFTVSGSRLLYTAQAVNPRWSLVSYSDIVELDLATGRERRLTRNRRYFTPSPAPSGTRMVAVEYSDSLRTYLAELSAGGDPLRRVAAPEGALFVHPAYIGEEQVVTALRWPDSRMSLEQVDLATGNRQTLVPPGVYTIGHPAVSGNRIIFTASFGGNDDLYALTRKDQNLFRLTSGSTGHYFPSVRGDSLYWSQFTATGYKIRSRSLDDLAGEAINPLMLGEEVLPFPVADRSPNLLDTADRPFPVSAYKGTEGWFRFHSWRPDYSDPEVTLTLASDNVLGNFSTDVFYRYNRADQSHGTGFNVRYGGFYPVLSAGAEYTFGRNVPLGNSTYLLDQAEARAGYSIPLNFTFGKTYKQLLFGTNATINQLLPRGLLKDSIADRTTPYLHHFVQWLHQRPRALQQIFPKWGYGFTLQHRHRLDAAGYQLAGSGQAYLPSAGNHSLVLSGAFQQVDTNNVLFSNRFSNARGYDERYFSRMWRASADYHLPLAYPDWGFAGIVYFLRVRGTLFYDHSRVYNRPKTVHRDLRSTGGEVWFDTKWWNQVPVTFGIRYSHLLDPEVLGQGSPHRWEFVLPVGLIPE